MASAKLHVGEFGDEVARLHESLSKRGFAVSAEEIKRKFFGPATRAAVIEIQKRLGLDATGKIDRKTAAALSVAGPIGSRALAAPTVTRNEPARTTFAAAPATAASSARILTSARTGGSLSGGTLHPGPHTPPSGGSINTGTTGPISGGTINPGPRYDAPTENLTKVANAFAANTKSVTMLVTLPAGLNLTEPVQISILFESARITQDYVNSSGNHFLYNFDDGDAQLRREPVAVTLHELAPGGQSYTFVWSIAIEPLYDITVSPLRFILKSPCDLVGNSEPEIHWLNADGSRYKEEISLSAGQIHVFNAFAHDYTEVSVADELRVPFIWWWEIDPWPFTFHPNPDPGFENILSGPSRTVTILKTDEGSPCMGKFIFTIIVTLRWYPDL